MDLEIRRLGVAELFNTLPECINSVHNPEKLSSTDIDNLLNSPEENPDMTSIGRSVIESIYRDDKNHMITQSKLLFKPSWETLERSVVSKFLHLCCLFDSVECASALLGGELGSVPLVNEVDDRGKAALHTAAESHASRCAELLLRKRARTELRTKDGLHRLPLELSLSSTRMNVLWNRDANSVEDLVVLLGEKDLSTIRLLSEKTKEASELACRKAIEGRIVDLAALLLVSAEKINESILEVRDTGTGSKEKMTIYECVIREALSLGRATTPSEKPIPNCSIGGDDAERRKLMLSQIELLQLFGVVAQSHCTEKKLKSPLIRAIQAGDEAVAVLLLNANIDINDVDADGNSALHWFFKASKGSCVPETSILLLLLKHGARVNQKNKLGFTAFHIAAANGNLQALQILLLEDPDGIKYKTEMKETPVFFAVNNDHMDCAELLLRWGANSEVFNLRRQRPIDMAKSQDMRFMLNPTNISLMNRNFSNQHKCTNSLQEDYGFWESCEALVSMTDENTTAERICPTFKTGMCKYFASPGGCVRGANCFYAHGEEESRQMKDTRRNHSLAMINLKRKIFVGGLPLSVDSDSLHKYFAEKFGPVENAIVVVNQTGNLTQSRGFGFVTFKDDSSVSAAVHTHYTTIMDKQVEMKSVIPKWLLTSDSQKVTSRQPHEQEKNDNGQPQVQISNEKIKEDSKPEQGSPWIDKVRSRTMSGSSDSQTRAKSGSEDKNMPTWLRIFKKWLPSFLYELSKHPKPGEYYALSSLKGDFRAKFGLELDHVSLGYSKLSDFIKGFADLCCIKVVPIGSRGQANHMVLVPKQPKVKSLLQLRMMPCTPSRSISTDDGGENQDSCGSKSLEDLSSGSSESAGPIFNGFKEESPSTENSDENSPQKDISPSVNQRLIQFLKQDPLFHVRPWLQTQCNSGKVGGKYERGCIERVNSNNLCQQQHLVLEALAIKRNSSSYFVREFDFYKNYTASVRVGRCFGCNKSKLLWSNFPCRHMLWCTECKAKILLVAGDFTHKCVVCDVEVLKTDLVPCHGYRHIVQEHIPQDEEEFPPFDPYHILRLDFSSTTCFGN
ncbi:hypothetical protein UlMin_014758 [Ulmus minor]